MSLTFSLRLLQTPFCLLLHYGRFSSSMVMVKAQLNGLCHPFVGNQKLTLYKPFSPDNRRNRDLAAASPDNASAKERASVYSKVHSSRINNVFPLPSVLKGSFKIAEGPASSAAGNPDEIAKLFPDLYGQPSVSVVPDQSAASLGHKLKIGVVFSGGQAPGGHNVISGLFGSTFYGFKDGPAGIMKCKYVELNAEYIQPYRNQGGFDMICSGRDKIETPEQFKQAEETTKKLDFR